MSEQTARKDSDETPEGAEAQEKTLSGDETVRDAVTAERETVEKGTKSVLPGPPIPPSVQKELRKKAQEPKKDK